LTPTGVDEMQCKELIELVTEYLEGTIAAAERERVEVHMGECEWCERYIEQTRQTIAALSRLDEGTGDREAWERALASFRSANRRL
jgi:anti-sigma factor RsiW